MEEKRFPQLEKEKNEGIVSDPTVEYATAGSGIADLSVAQNIRDEWDPEIGPYSMKELNDRIDEADAAIGRYMEGDRSEWVTENQSRENFYTKYTWLK